MYVVFSILVKLLHNIFGHNTDCGVLFLLHVFQQLFCMTC